MEYSEGSDSDVVNDPNNEEEEESKISGKKLDFNAKKIEHVRSKSEI